MTKATAIQMNTIRVIIVPRMLPTTPVLAAAKCTQGLKPRFRLQDYGMSKFVP